MAGCSDKKYGDLLALYELGLLSDSERDNFELHLFECEDCFEKVKQFKDTIFLVNNSPRVREIVDQSLESPSPQTKTDKEPQTTGLFKSKRLLPSLIPAIAVALIIIVLILKPWHIEFKPGDEAFATQNRLAIMYFNNISNADDPERLGQVITSLLITDLSESQYVRVVSHEHLYDIMRLLGQEDVTSISRETAMEIAEKAGARWMLMGDIIEKDSSITIASQLVEVASGDIIAGQKIDGQSDEDIFDLVDRLTVEVKSDLSLPAGALNEMDYRIADVTTHSPEAYKYYLEGINFLSKVYRTEAEESFRRALHYDTTFAMVYYYLSLYVDGGLIKEAVNHMDNITRREKLYIMSRDAQLSRNFEEAITILQSLVESYPDEKKAFFRLAQALNMAGRFDEAVVFLEKAIDIDPLYKEAINLLVYQYERLGDIDRALETIDRYIAIAPDEANPYDTKGEICARNGMIEMAIDAYKTALEIKPDFASSIWNLGVLSLYKADFDVADRMFRKLAVHSNASYRTSGRLAISYIPIRQGKYNEALSIIDDAIAANRLDGFTGLSQAINNLVKAFIYMEIDDYDAAGEEISTFMFLQRTEFPKSYQCFQCFQVQILAESDLFDEAEKTAEELKATLEQLDITLEYYWYALGSIALAKKDYDTAVGYFERAAEDIPSFYASYMLAVARLKAGMYDKAITDFEKINISVNAWRAVFSFWDVKTTYMLGLAYDATGETEKASEYFRQYLEILRDADTESPEMKNARQKLESYKNI